MKRLLPSLAFCLLASACAGRDCPPVDEQAIARRVLDEVERRLADPEGAEIADATGSAFDAIPFAELPRRGASEPRVRLVVISDFECPYCAVYAPTLDELLDEEDDVAVYFLHYPLPFHAHAALAAQAAIEARAQGGDAAFYRMHDALFRHRNALELESLLGYATELGLDAERMRAALADGRHRATLERDAALAERLGVNGTPTTIVEGEALVGAAPYDELEDLVARKRRAR